MQPIGLPGARSIYLRDFHEYIEVDSVSESAIDIKGNHSWPYIQDVARGINAAGLSSVEGDPQNGGTP